MKAKVVSQVSFSPQLSGAHARAIPLVNEFVLCIGLRIKASKGLMILLISGQKRLKGNVNGQITAAVLSFTGRSAGVNQELYLILARTGFSP